MSVKEEFMVPYLKKIRLESEIKEKENRIIMERDKINSHYDEIILQIKKKRDKELRELDDKLATLRDRNYEIIRRYDYAIDRMNRIKDYLRVKHINLTIPDDYEFVFKTVEPLGYIFNDTYLKVKMFITLNHKPVNKFSLVAVGRTMFTTPDKLLIRIPDLWESYQGYEYIIIIKDDRNPDKLKAYYRRNQKKIRMRVIGNYNEVKADYLDAVSKYKLEDFTSIRELSDEDAPLICRVRQHKEPEYELRLAKSIDGEQYYKREIGSEIKNKEPWDCIRVNNKIYGRFCSKSDLRIDQWESSNGVYISIRRMTYGFGLTNPIFSKDNFEKVVQKAQEIRKKWDAYISYPEITWFGGKDV